MTGLVDVTLRDVTMRRHRSSVLATEGVLVGHGDTRVLVSLDSDQAEILATILAGLTSSADADPRFQVDEHTALLWHHAMVDLLACRAMVDGRPMGRRERLAVVADFEAAAGVPL